MHNWALLLFFSESAADQRHGEFRGWACAPHRGEGAKIWARRGQKKNIQTEPGAPWTQPALRGYRKRQRGAQTDCQPAGRDPTTAGESFGETQQRGKSDPFIYWTAANDTKTSFALLCLPVLHLLSLSPYQCESLTVSSKEEAQALKVQLEEQREKARKEMQEVQRNGNSAQTELERSHTNLRKLEEEVCVHVS